MNALPAPPSLARSTFLYDVTEDRTLYSANADAPLPMASTTKIMTALVALTYGHPSDWVTASANAATIGQSTMYLQQGERLRLRDLLYGLMLPSGNDAAIAIAEHVGGSEARFVALMNREAAQLGMTHTHYVTPHGLDISGHYTTTRDMARLTIAAMSLPELRRIVSTRYYTIPATAHNVEHVLININQPLWWYPGTIGVKPGWTGEDGHCAAEWVERDHHTLLLIVLGDVNLVTDVRDLLNWGFADFSRWHSPLRAPVVYAPEYFGWDTPAGWIALPHGGQYYERTGHTVQEPLIGPYLAHGGFSIYGPPTGEAFMSHKIWQQRFSSRWLFYNQRTRRVGTRRQDVS